MVRLPAYLAYSKKKTEVRVGSNGDPQSENDGTAVDALMDPHCFGGEEAMPPPAVVLLLLVAVVAVVALLKIGVFELQMRTIERRLVRTWGGGTRRTIVSPPFLALKTRPPP